MNRLEKGQALQIELNPEEANLLAIALCIYLSVHSSELEIARNVREAYGKERGISAYEEYLEKSARVTERIKRECRAFLEKGAWRGAAAGGNSERKSSPEELEKLTLGEIQDRIEEISRRMRRTHNEFGERVTEKLKEQLREESRPLFAAEHKKRKTAKSK